jgi:hypothetical protein
MCKRYTRIAAAVSLALTTFAGQAGPANKTWACSSYFWTWSSCWTPAVVPTSADTVSIAPVGTYDAEVKIDGATGSAVAGTLNIDSTLAHQSATLSMSGSNLSTSVETIGVNGIGWFKQSGGSNTVVNGMTLGYSAGSFGYYTLSSGTLTDNALIIGQSGNGYFDQQGGSHVAASLAFGTNLAGGGVYNIYAGTLNVIGAITTGSGSGTLSLNGGALTVGSGNISVTSFLLGEGAAGNYTQTHGAVTANVLSVGGAYDGTYTLSGGTLDVGGAITTGTNSSTPVTGTLNLNGGVLTVASGNIGVTNLNLGSVAGSNYSYVQTKGTVAVGGNLNLGMVTESAGSYTLSGGFLSVTGKLAGGAGVSTLNLDGGAFTVGNGKLEVTNLTLGSQPGSSFVLNIDSVWSGGTFTSLSTSTMTIGGLGAAQVYQIGGSNTVGTLTINDGYYYSGGSLVVTNSLVNNGIFQLYGTTLNNAGTTENNGSFDGHGRINSGGAFTNNGIVSQDSGTLTLAGGGLFTNNGNWAMTSTSPLKLDGSSFENAGVLNLNGSPVTGTGTLTNAIGGTVAGGGTIATTFANAGTLALTDSATTVTKGFVNSGVIQLGGNTALLNGGALTNTGLIQGHGKVASAITNTGSIQASGGTLTLTQAMSNGGTLVADNASTLLFQSGLTANSGNIRIDGGALNNTGHTLSNSGQIQASTGASRLYGGVTGLAGSQLIVSGGGSLTLYDTVDIQTGAELRVSAGASATFFGQVFQRTGSTFSGTGITNFEGGLSVGASPGLGVNAGNVSFGAGNLYLAEIGGTTACTAACATNDALKNSSFDKYVVAGNLALGGTLKLVSWNGFVAQAGQSFDLLDWGSTSGSFSSIDASGLVLAAGALLDTSMLYTSGVINVTAVPEPGTWATMLAGLSTLGLYRRRIARSAMSA